MAMACVLSTGLSSLSLAPPATSAIGAPDYRLLRSTAAPSLSGGRLISVKGCRFRCFERRNVVIKATSAEGADVDVVAEPAAPVEAPINPIAALKLQSDLLKKKAKKLELRRKRLVRKRHLRKKGRWPPSKMKKNKNV